MAALLALALALVFHILKGYFTVVAERKTKTKTNPPSTRVQVKAQIVAVAVNASIGINASGLAAGLNDHRYDLVRIF